MFIHIMLVRALRCNLEYAEALSICIDAHEKYPDHPDIDAEFKVLTSILGLKPYPEDDDWAQKTKMYCLLRLLKTPTISKT